MQLKYHERAFDLLGYAPGFNNKASVQLDEWEQYRNIKLPPAMREWYTAKGALSTMNRYSNQDHPLPVERLDGFEKSADGSDLLIFLIENQGVLLWGLQLDGSENPPVLIRVNEAGEVWKIHANTFSDFVYTLIWDGLFAPVCLSAHDNSLAQDDLSFLRETFAELPSTYHHFYERIYRFESSEQRITIRTGTSGVNWFLRTDTSKELEQLALRVWKCGNLSHQLRSSDFHSGEVIRRIRRNVSE